MKGVSMRWKELTVEQKQPFVLLSKLDRVRYEKEIYLFRTGRLMPADQVTKLPEIFNIDALRASALEVPDELV